ncbi:ParB/Srx family N-terminal domain-containing protein [Pseudomonas huanghezhanensis]|uniref:ParB/Srx family N-terminal domain-containing protein n=1 Tax=Pseudomonas huanghezhanensis TaxID=3002903 RepID=UPI0022868C01|nr:ParB/Srx family N-terminal domain-containing protein [Pseudomonas sp. BSw22131]
MRIQSCCAALLACVFAVQVQAAFTAPKPGDVIEVTLDQLHPTQAVVGFDQIYYKLERFAKVRQKLFDEICETNGQHEAKKIKPDADPLRPETFACEDAPNAHPNDMKTVVIGPEGKLYLTDGHHTFTTLWEQPGAGPQMKMKVRVSDNFSDSKDLADFWQRMTQARKVWLKDGNGQSIAPSQLPDQLGLQAMQNDIFRSIVYFVRDAAYTKPKAGDVSPEFLEFYWGDWLRGQMPLEGFDLSQRSGYHQALQAASDLIVEKPSSKIIGGDLSARQLGALKKVRRNTLTRIASEKLPYVIDYKKDH